jgi:hypothetical protein
MEELWLSEAQFETENLSRDNIAELSKALLSPASSDDLYNTPGGVTVMQSLEGMLATLMLKDTDFTFWYDMNKIKAFSTVEEFDRETGWGVSDGGFVDEIENPEYRNPDFEKEVVTATFMSEGWSASDVSRLSRRIVDERQAQQEAAMKRLLRNLSLNCYIGNKDWLPKSFDGIEKVIADQGYTNQIIDLRGNNVSTDTFNVAGQTILEANGEPGGAYIYVSPAGVQNLHKIILAAGDETNNRKIVDLGDGNMTIGGKIANIQTAFGVMRPRTDKLLGMAYENNGVPIRRDITTKTFVESATSLKAPSTPTATATAVGAPVAGSLFSAGTTRPSGTKQRYRVSARNEYGRSIATSIFETAGNVAAGGAVDIEITPYANDSGSKAPTCFVIYGEKEYGSGEFRYLDTIKAASPNPLVAVTYQDKNIYIPATARMYIVDRTSTGRDRVMSFSQLLPVHNTPLGKLGRYEHGLVNLYGMPKYYKPNTLIEIRNVGIDKSNINQYNFV